VIRIDIGSLPEGDSHLDLEEDASQLDIDLQGVRLVSPVKVRVGAVFECARCLDEYECTLSGPVGAVVLVGEAPVERVPDEEGVLRVPGSAKYADITEQIRSEILVRVPLKALCKEDCRGLCPSCGINLNCERCSCRAMSGDPRWDGLKDVK
jgi:uncharacterized protein